MSAVEELLETRFRNGARAAFGAGFERTDPELRPATRPEFGHFQSNLPLRLARTLGRPPRAIAHELLDALDLDDICLPPRIAGPGFVNLTVRVEFLAAQVAIIDADPRLGVAPVDRPQRIVVDYSGPNVGKELHVGHLRSTIIGDALTRLLEFLGHTVIRRNHLGDWGTTFGMLIEHFVDIGSPKEFGDLTDFYQAARRKFSGDGDFADRARRRVVLLQGGDQETLALWRHFIAESQKHFQAVYDALSITLTPEDNRGESAYNDGLPGLVEELDGLGLLRRSDGALCLFPEGFTGRDGAPFPIIVRKRDGGYTYEATDLVAIRERLLDLRADRIYYVVASEQRLRLQMLFQAAREAGWLEPPATAEHVSFGLVLGTDRKRLRTRSGDLPKLADLLSAAVERAESVIAEKAPHLDPAERAAVARAVGIGAIKFGDLGADRIKDYLFDLEQMVSFDGDTAPYVQYARARIGSIFRRGGVDPAALGNVPLLLGEPAEQDLALRLCRFGEVVHRAAGAVELHRICGYLTGLAASFTTFYETCPVLRADDERLRDSRLRLCDVTARVLATGLSLLGITAPERM